MKKFLSVLFCMVLCLSLGMSQIAVNASEADAQRKLYPEDLLASEEKFGEYFSMASNCLYETVNGEYVMTIPDGVVPASHSAVPYDAYTVQFDAALILYRQETAGVNSGEEICFIFGKGSSNVPFHQVRLFNNNGLLQIMHEKNNREWIFYEEDTTLLLSEVNEQDLYFTVTIQIDETNVYVYVDGEFVVQLTDTEGCVGDNGYIGMRASGEGYKLKNFNVYEGLIEPEDIGSGNETTKPSETPSGGVSSEAPTEMPTQTPEQTANPTVQPTQNSGGSGGNGGIAPWIWIVVVAVAVVVVGCVIVVILTTKKKK